MFNSRQLASRLVSLLFTTALLGSTSLAAQTLDDPMRPPTGASSGNAHQGGKKAQKSAPRSGFYLSAIRISKDRRSATINGKTVSIGERIGAARVIAIQSSSVTLQHAGKTQTISLLPLSIKKPVEASQP